MKRTYIHPTINVEETAIETICLVVSTTPADNSDVLAPERDDTEWEEF